MILIVVESPTKAKAINEYLKGTHFVATSTYGHVRNLLNKANSINTSKNFEYVWEYTTQWKKNAKETLAYAQKAEKIIIATDLDREGEGIAWHFLEILKENAINKPIERIIFDSISKESIKSALNNPTHMRTGLIQSYLGRIGLDYLFGYSISPLLWRKIPCCKSAGRVQSVALRLIVERENEIKSFISEKYETVHAQFKNIPLDAQLVKLDAEEFENGNIFNQTIDLQMLEKGQFEIIGIKKQKILKNPDAPFITSSLQQVGSSKLNFSPKLTMQLAQQLYEGFSIKGKHTGLITYMRTDSFTINSAFVEQIRQKITEIKGEQYLSKTIAAYKNSDNSQEAHEAIRPVDMNIHPEDLNLKDKKLESLYKLIWERTLASQAAAAQLESTKISIQGTHDTKYKQSIFEVRSTEIVFAGYKIFLSSDHEEDEEILIKANLSKLSEKQSLELIKLFAKEHATQPPKRFSEANLIQQIKKKGIGRPSTYARIIEVLYEREYASKEKKIIVPTQKGWIVTGFLTQFFPEEIAYEFTANLEAKLDKIKEADVSYLPLLNEFWNNLDTKIQATKTHNPIVTSEMIRAIFPKYFKSNETTCPDCGNKLVLKITKFGAMIGCTNYPACKKIIKIDEEAQKVEQKMLGMIDECDVFLKHGPYGQYIEIANDKLKRISVPKILQNQEITLEHAMFLNELPKKIGQHNGNDIIINIGKFGPYVQYQKTYASIKDLFNITLGEAIAAIEAKLNAPASKKK